MVFWTHCRPPLRFRFFDFCLFSRLFFFWTATFLVFILVVCLAIRADKRFFVFISRQLLPLFSLSFRNLDGSLRAPSCSSRRRFLESYLYTD